MSKNIIFYFTGTGNSLQTAKIIAKELEDCELQLVSTYHRNIVPAGYERIGFVYPVYSGYPPHCMMEFVDETDFSMNPDAYYFQVTSYGGSSGNSCLWMKTHLQKKGVVLSASFGVPNKPNYIVSYSISKDVETKPEKARKKASAAAGKIVHKESTKLQRSEVKLFAFMNHHIAYKFSQMDKDYIISDACIGCGICSKVCPVENIRMVDSHPAFEHRCEQCMACIHNCPKQALNYKNVTIKRNRYRNPDVTLQELYRK